MLRLDTDFYRSTKHELVYLYPRLSTGGVMIIDDYSTYQGSRIVTDDYLRENNLKIMLSHIDESVLREVRRSTSSNHVNPAEQQQSQRDREEEVR
jgi:hypothetical protein